jgi:hypothetical protein
MAHGDTGGPGPAYSKNSSFGRTPFLINRTAMRQFLRMALANLLVLISVIVVATLMY